MGSAPEGSHNHRTFLGRASEWTGRVVPLLYLPPVIQRMSSPSRWPQLAAKGLWKPKSIPPCVGCTESWEFDSTTQDSNPGYTSPSRRTSQSPSSNLARSTGSNALRLPMYLGFLASMMGLS